MLVSPLTVSRQLVRLDVPIMVEVSILLALLARDGTIGRIEGAFLHAGIAACMAYLILDAQGHDALPAFSSTMLEIVITLTVVTLLVLVAHGALRRTGKRFEGS